MSSQLRSMRDVFLRTWYLGFTSFGGPAVHFQIFHRLFVEGQDPWIDEQTVRIVVALMPLLCAFASSFLVKT
jgi:chromate transport protein ChrA